MKTKILSFIFFILCLNIHCQNLIGTRWLKVNEERKDGSIIHDRLNTKNSMVEYYFKSLNKVSINSIKPDATYKIENSKLTIGNQKFNVEKLNDTELVICEKGELNTPDDRKNRLFFIKSNKIIDYSIDNELLTFLNDSTITAKKYLNPKLKNNKSLSTVITKSFKNQKFSNSKDKRFQRGFLMGNFHINTSGKIDMVEITQNSQIFKGIEANLTKALKKIDFIPFEIDKKYNQLVDFNAVFEQFKGFYGIHIDTNTSEKPILSRKRGLTIDERRRSQQFYLDGNNEFTKKNYVEALKNFTNVIKIDSLFFDAYYNRAYTNMIIKNTKESCKDWGYLKSKGQKEGMRLYNLKCE